MQKTSGFVVQTVLRVSDERDAPVSHATGVSPEHTAYRKMDFLLRIWCFQEGTPLPSPEESLCD